jgi:hypothetical protein
MLRCGLWMGGIIAVIGVLFVVGEYAQRMYAYSKAREHPHVEALMRSGPDLGPEPTEPIRHMVANAYHRLPRPWEQAKFEKFKHLPVYELRIAPDDRQALRDIAELVQAAEYSAGIERPWFDAEFRLEDGRWLDIEVKLRGTTSQHYLRERPSLRLKFPKEHPLNGRRQVNITDAADKLLTQDVTTNWELSRYGILTWHSDFDVLKINGEVIGLFQEIEQFGRSMTDPALRTEGFIFSGLGQSFGASGDDEAGANTDAFGWDKAEPGFSRFAACRDQRSVPAQQGPCDWAFVEEFTDTDRFAWATAMTTLLGSSHAWSLDNFRTYYDPARGKFEPIPWDYLSYYIEPEKAPDGETARLFGAGMLRLPEFRRMRDERLWTLINERVEPMIGHAREMFVGLEEPLKYMPRNPANYWNSEVHRIEVEDKMRANATFLRKLYEDNELRAGGSWSQLGQFVVELENHGKAAALVSEVTLEHGGKPMRISLETPHLVDGVWAGKPGRSSIWLKSEARGAVSISKDAKLAALTARNSVTGQAFAANDVTVSTGLTPSLLTPPPPAPLPAVKTPGNVRLAGSRLVFGPGPVRIDSTIEVPRDYTVEFRPGLQLTLAKGASLILYGDLESKGTANNPVTISGVDATLDWGSLVVQGTRMDPSNVRLEYTTLRGGTGAQNARAHFTGAFAVIDGVVTIHNSRFLDLNSEDGLNLRYSQLDFQNNLVRGAPDDVIDLDFCKGVAMGNLVEHGGGDGFDMSGSRMTIEQNRIRYCADKGISVGEGTIVEIRDNLIYDCRTGIASKDGSVAKIIDNGLARVAVGLALYRKKLTFGQPSAEVQGLALAEVETPLLVRPGAHLEITSSARYVSAGERPLRSDEYGELKTIGMPNGSAFEKMLFSNGNSEPGIQNAVRIPR